MNSKPIFANPITILFLMLPFGISAGFVSVTLPFLLVQHGFSVAAAASITAVGLSSNIWRFLWAPLADLTLSLHKWYKIGLCMCVVSLFLLVFIPLDVAYSGILMGVVFISQVAATFVASPVCGFMAKAIEEDKKGRAAGYFQSGNLGGMGIGGGAGIWLASHISYEASCMLISLSMLLCVFALYFVPQIQSDKAQTLTQGFQSIVLGIKELFRSRLAIFTTVMILTPIGQAAASYVWSSVADDWHVPTDTVALVTGGLSGLASAIGCIIGGWVADKVGRWWAYFGSGALLALVTLIMSISPFTPLSYTSGVLWYALMGGFAYAAFSAILLFAIGKHLAATKYALLSSITNIAVVYMIAFDGWFHDKYGVKAMLLGETFLGISFVVVSLFALSWFKIADSSIDNDSWIETN
jgi:PAT family beta-lactamase induction signal transducer AmpG